MKTGREVLDELRPLLVHIRALETEGGAFQKDSILLNAFDALDAECREPEPFTGDDDPARLEKLFTEGGAIRAGEPEKSCDPSQYQQGVMDGCRGQHIDDLLAEIKSRVEPEKSCGDGCTGCPECLGPSGGPDRNGQSPPTDTKQPPTLDEAMDLARNELDLWESPIVPSNSIFIGEEVQRLLDSNKQVIDAYDKHVERRGNEKARRIYCHWCGLPIKVKEGG